MRQAGKGIEAPGLSIDDLAQQATDQMGVGNAMTLTTLRIVDVVRKTSDLR